MKKVEIISNANVHAEEERKMKVEELISLLKNGGSVTVETAVSKGNLAASTNKSKQVPKINVCAPDTVGDLINQMRGEGMSEGVRGYFLSDACQKHGCLYHLEHRDPAQ